jgi:hypothetical protein
MSIHSRNDLIQYALRKLGHPVIKISVAQEQVEDRVDEALQFFQDFHYDSTERVYLKHQITGTQIVVNSTVNFLPGEFVIGQTTGNRFQITHIDSSTNFTTKNVVSAKNIPAQTFNFGEVLVGQTSGASATFVSKTAGDTETGFIPVSDMVTGIIRVIPWWHATSNPNAYLFDPKYQAILATFNSLASGSLIYYEQMMQHISTMDQVLRPVESFRFNRKMSQVYLDFDWATAQIGSFIIVECYRILDPEVFVEIYNDRMLKKLVTAKIKYQWAQNLSLYAGVQLLGGVTVDAASLMAQASAEIQSAEEEIREVYECGTIGFVG